MGYWIFMVAMDLLIPAAVFGFGCIFRKNPPEDINYGYGYRTKRSMINKDTWMFAQKTMGKIWYKTGMAMFLTVLPMVFFINSDADIVSVAGGVICCVQLVLMLATIFPVEKALKETFDSQGNRKQ